MLTVALTATLIGFALLVVALIFGNFWLAVACIAVCVLGLIVLAWDTIRSSRGDDAADEPIFTIRDREARGAQLSEAASPSVPVVGGVGQPAPEPSLFGGGQFDAPAAFEPAAFEPASSIEPGAVERPVTGPLDLSESGLGSLVAAGSDPVVDDALSEPVSGDANDYIRSVTGSFPAQPASGEVAPSSTADSGTWAVPGSWADSGSWPVATAPYAESSAPAQALGRGPDTGPIPAASPYVGRRRRYADAPVTFPADFGRDEPTDSAPAAAEAGRAGTGAVDAAAPASEPVPVSAIYTAPVGEQTSDSDPIGHASGAIIVRDHTGALPKITYVDDSTPTE